jgi:citrate lyase subunit beta / citryl-CoA lyase
MTSTLHPNQALFDGQKAMPALSTCEHFAGSEKLIRKAMQLQVEYGPIFDVTCDCEDGARIGVELEHAQMVASLINSEDNRFGKLGVRIHDPSHPLWRQDVDVIVGSAAARVAYVTIPKSTSSAQAAEVIDYVQASAARAGVQRKIPIHVLVETHGALEEVVALAKLPHVEVLDFGQMDFVSDHAGAIPASAMKSPQQFEHPILVRAKTNLVAAALAHGVVPAHNVCVALTDEAVIAGDAHRAHVEFGFQRMWSIHPFQIRPIVAAMRPAAEELSKASEILLAAQRADWGPIQHAGELHDRATYRYFWAILRRAHATGMPLDDQAKRQFF